VIQASNIFQSTTLPLSVIHFKAALIMGEGGEEDKPRTGEDGLVTSSEYTRSIILALRDQSELLVEVVIGKA
jgi:hypothetical protein